MSLTPNEKYKDLVQRTRAKLTQKLDGQPLASPEKLMSLFNEILAEEDVLLTKTERERLFDQVTAQLPPDAWEVLLKDNTIQEIAIIGANNVFVRHYGDKDFVKVTHPCFDDEVHLIRVMDRILGLVNEHVDTNKPFAQCQMPDGSSVRVLLDTLRTQRSMLVIQKADKKG